MLTRVTRSVIERKMESAKFVVPLGVPQGAVLSPWFYAVFINDLAMELLRRGCGVSLFGRRVPLLLFADDIALLARNPLELQKMLDVVFNFSRSWRFVFNHRKIKK
jgi:hypothetical protein